MNNFVFALMAALAVSISGQEAEIKRILEEVPGVEVKRAGPGVELSGTLATEQEAAKVALVCALYPGVYNLVTDLRADRIIQMDVEIIEINASDGSELGLDWFAAEQNTIAVGETHVPDRLSLNPQYAVGSLARLNPLTAQLHFLVNKGKGEVLARPKLVCKSGDSAVFMAGGEVPLPYATQDRIQVDWKGYGIRLEIKPALLKYAGGEIMVRVDCEISDLDWANGVKEYPAVVRKEVSTRVRMNAGEMLALAGMISKKKSRVQKRLPLLGAIPFLGRLFSSTRDEVRDMETVILLTPRIVHAGKGDNIRLGQRN